jgi:plasmid stability protein
MGTLNLRPIPDDLHRALKIEAATRGTSIRALVIQVLQEWVKREAGKPARRKGGGA